MMKNIKKHIVVLALSLPVYVNGQSNDSSVYMAMGGEIVLAFSNINPSSFNSIPRLSAFLHLQFQLHWNTGKHTGFYTGMALRNIGIIYKEPVPGPGDAIRYKHRAYTLGLPLALKLGNMKKDAFVYAGGEMEWAFHYKQKRFEDGHKEISNNWFGHQVHHFLPSVFAGFKLSGGLNIRFKYYPCNFLNQEYTIVKDGVLIKPFSGLNTRLFYISVSTLINKKKHRKTSSKELKQA
jgi:hypothetical protein